jgi:hypothetical protein
MQQKLAPVYPTECESSQDLGLLKVQAEPYSHNIPIVCSVA